jgi:hypothetical protein
MRITGQVSRQKVSILRVHGPTVLPRFAQETITAPRNNNSSAAVQFVLGLVGDVHEVIQGTGAAGGSSILQRAGIGVGYDSTSSVDSDAYETITPNIANASADLIVLYQKLPSIGFHYYAPIERDADNAGTVTFFGFRPIIVSVKY